MIPANELRIGNWVFNSHGQYVKITTLSKYKDIHDISSLCPVPLTPKILEKAGFKDLYDNGRYSLLGFEYYDGKLWFDTSEVRIEFLHQLQNLYFALIGEEFAIDLS